MADTNTSIQFIFLVILSSRFLYLETVKLCSSTGNDTVIGCLETERNALLKFKEGLADPSDRLSSWVGRECCRWAGVLCNNRSGFVTKLKLRNQYSSSDSEGDGTSYALGGEISASLLDLKHLTYLDLSMNSFAGMPIPNFIGSLKTLRYLNLSGAGFGGPIPLHLKNLSSLRYLDLNSYSSDASENELNWLSGLSSLKHLNLAYVNLTKAELYWLQAVNMLPSLVELYLPFCGLSTLPVSLPRVNLTSISVLDLSNNVFNSSIPSWLFNLSSLTYLDLSSNNLQGEVLDGFSGLNCLRHLDLSMNSFLAGKLSQKLGKLCDLRLLDLSFNMIKGETNEFINSLAECSIQRLESLHLQYNQLSGFLPDSLGYLKNLKYLRLQGNLFLGSIPETIGNLLSLEELDLSENKMTGSIPMSLGQLSTLVVLDISTNQWEGIITEAHFLNLTSLKELSITQLKNNITLVFNLSPEWVPSFKLRYLDLNACLVGPKFPEWLRNQNELIHIGVWNAKISGPIPDWFWKLDLFFNYMDFSYNQLTGSVPNTIRFQNLATVYLNNNHFTGPLPLLSSNVSILHLDNNFFSGPIALDIGEKMPLLSILDISYNSLVGSIPLSMANLSSLFTFVLSNNHLTGEIPEFWNTLPTVSLIDVSNNGLSGNIPISFGSLIAIKFLRLSNNKLSGEIPPALQNCTNLLTLDLGKNRLSGKIPPWIGGRTTLLLILSLRSNMIVGEIPMEICSLSFLHILDLAQNNLSGHIPSCLGNLSGMTTVFDSDSERYDGQLWVEAKGRSLFYDNTLFLVNSINLSGNNLSGKMPKEIVELSRLGTLNLSMNHLTGEIPANIGNLHWLETLDLSRNGLSGTIPSSMASITSLNHLDLAYNNLSGKIPSTNQFQTFNDPSIYEGNPELCGSPLPTKCNGDDTETSQLPAAGNAGDENGEEDEMFWFYISIGPGFVAGFWGVCGTLILKKSWRDAYFKFIDDMKRRTIAFSPRNLAHRYVDQQ